MTFFCHARRLSLSDNFCCWPLFLYPQFVTTLTIFYRSILFLSYHCCCFSADRKKDLVKLATGEYISLGKIESALKQSPYIDNCCAYVDGEQYFPIVLVIPNPKHLKTLAATVGVNTDSFEVLCSEKKVNKAMLSAIESVAKGKFSLLSLVLVFQTLGPLSMHLYLPFAPSCLDCIL